MSYCNINILNLSIASIYFLSYIVMANLIREELKKILTWHYSCSRVWEAWQYWTMTQDDFHPLEEDENIYKDIESLILSLPLQQQWGNEKIKELIERKIESLKFMYEWKEPLVQKWSPKHFWAIVCCEQLILEIDNLPPQSQWIPVSERFPETLTSILIAYDWYRVTLWFWDWMKYRVAADAESITTVTHWQPLPLPPNN